MQQLLYGTEVRSIEDIEIPKTEVKDAELKLAHQLIEQQTAERFDPSAYADEVRARVKEAIEKKIEGQEITIAAPAETGGAQVIDLMEALRASLEKKPATKAKESAPAERKPPKRARATEPAIKKAARR
jgi:DNA end-binding protein Ku